MKIYSKPINDTKYSNISEFIPFPKKRACYIDIETTGFNRKKDMIYLIGLLYEDNHQLNITQYLCQKPEDEYELLYKLNTFLKDFDYLVHFNGDSFDLPFIKERMGLYRIEEGLSALESYDFYRKVKPLKRIIQTDNFKLKTMEAICGYNRIDPFTGGELIALYNEYLHGDLGLEPSFIIHNEEDMIGLYYLNRLLPLIDISQANLENHFDFRGSSLNILQDMDPGSWEFHIPLSTSASPYTFNVSDGIVYSELSDLGFYIRSSLSKGEKKLYFDDYKNYYYLPEEDTAIHSSVASFMSSKYRKKATPATAYIKKEDIFVKVPVKREKLISLISDVHIFNDSYKDDYSYLLVRDFEKHYSLILTFYFNQLL